MADGKTHAKVNKVVASIVLIPICIATILAWEYDIFIYNIIFLAGIIFGYWFGPDLDVDSLNIDEYRLGNFLSYSIRWINFKNKEFQKKCVNGFTFAVKIWWIVYGLAISHRSPLSHLPIVADILRILYCVVSLQFILTALYIVYLTFLLFFGVSNSINTDIINILNANIDILKYLFSFEDWQQKTIFVLGSALMTFSHLMMDGFKIRW